MARSCPGAVGVTTFAPMTWAIRALVLGAALLGACQRGASDAGDQAADQPAAPASEAMLPGAEPVEAALADRLRAAAAARPPTSPPAHRAADGSPRFVNRLVLEPGPHLHQHAHDPVDWHPWGPDALAKAVRLERPLLVSIGHATCAPCQNMADESFADIELAQRINQSYVPIKVDRDERPDLAMMGRAAASALSGSSDWPLTLWLTPEGVPFFAGGYFPPQTRGRQPGFLDVIERLTRSWKGDPDRLRKTAAGLLEILQRQAVSRRTERLDEVAVLHAAAEHYRSRFDAEHAGFDSGPHAGKAPAAQPVRFLLRYWRRSGISWFRRMAELTLEAMVASPVHDQLGGGFHHQSGDAAWGTPRFDKTLADNASLVIAYLEGFQATGRRDFARVASGILEMVRRDLTSPAGGFFAGIAAGSSNYYTWTPREIDEVVGVEDGAAVRAYHGVGSAGRSPLSASRTPADLATGLGLEPAAIEALLDRARASLLAARGERPAPIRDEAIGTARNGLMIEALARASVVLAGVDPRAGEYAERARAAAGFVLEQLREDGRLRRAQVNGEADGDAFLEDYAFLIAGLLALFEATGEPRWLGEAIALDRVLSERHEDRAGGFWHSAEGREPWLVRSKPGPDGAFPGGNSVHALNLVRLAALTLDATYGERADRTVAAFGDRLASDPTALGAMLLALDLRTDRVTRIALIGAPALASYGRLFAPSAVMVPLAGADAHAALAEHLPWLPPRSRKPGAYACGDKACKGPLAPVRRALQDAAPLPLPAPVTP